MTPKDPNKPHDPSDNGGLFTLLNLAKLFVGTVLFSIVQTLFFSYNSIVDWSKLPTWPTFHQVLHAVPSAAALGCYRGVLVGAMAVAISWIGPAGWAIVGPVLAAAARSTVDFVSNISHAMRDTSDDKKSDNGTKTGA